MRAYWEVCSVYCKTQKEICLRHSVLRLLQSGQVGTVRLRILPLNNWRSHEVEFFLLWRSKRSLEEFRIQNWEKWSVRSEIIFPLVMISSRLLAKRLSISEYELWSWEDTEAFYWKYHPTQGCFLRGQLIRLNPI